LKHFLSLWQHKDNSQSWCNLWHGDCAVWHQNNFSIWWDFWRVVYGLVAWFWRCNCTSESLSPSQINLWTPVSFSCLEPLFQQLSYNICIYSQFNWCLCLHESQRWSSPFHDYLCWWWIGVFYLNSKNWWSL
jgi:hypothetical protein